MSIFTAVKAIFGSSPEKVYDVAAGVGGFIDESFYTDEEKAQAHFKLLEHKLKWINATQGQNLARRYCAIFFGLNFILTFQACLFMLIYGYFSGADVDPFVNGVIELASAFDVGLIMLTIIGFYFGKEFFTSKSK